MLTVSNIKKTFYSKEERQDVLKNISFSLPDKGMYFIVGKSGSGKSTLLNLIGGLDTPDSGSIEFNGLQLEKLSPKELSSYRARSIGFVFQESNLFDDLSVEDNLTIPVDRKISKAEIESILKRFDLFGLEKQKVNTLSGGEKQRVAIMRAVLKNPEMILCDEPTGSLDEENSKNIFTILKNLSKEKLVIVVSHDRKSAEDFGDGIIEIKDGVINLNNELKDTYDNKENYKKQLKISFRKQLKIAFSLMKKRLLRLVLMFLICIISFPMIGVSVSVTGLSPAETIVKEMYKDNNRLLFLYDFNHVYEEKNTAIKDKDIVSLKEKGVPVGDDPLVFYNTFYYSLSPYSECDYIAHGLEINEDKLANLGLTLLAGSLPKEGNEVVITDYFFDQFKKYGVYTYDNMNDDDLSKKVTTIDSYDDIIGKNITFRGRLKVTGVIGTNYDKNVYEAKLDDKQLGRKTTQYKIEKFLFLSKEYQNYIQQYNSYSENLDLRSGIIIKLTGDFKRDVSIIQSIDDQYIDFLNFANTEKRYFCSFSNEQVEGVYYFNRSFQPNFKLILIPISILLILLTVVMISIYLSGLLSEKQKMVGLLQSIGVNKKTIISIFSIIAIIVSVISIAISFLVQYLSFLGINSYLISNFYLNSNAYGFYWYTIFILIGISIASILIGIVVPTIKLYKKKSVDLIRE